MSDYIFLINPSARSGKTTKLWPVIETYLKEHRCHYTFRMSQRLGDIANWTAWYALHGLPDNTYLVVVGGDGTLNEALNGILHAKPAAQLPLAYIPAGSGNDFARAHGLPSTPLAALEMILNTTATQPPKLVDIGVYADSLTKQPAYFVNNIGIGFDALALYHTNHSRTKKVLNALGLGKLAYLTSIVKTLVHQVPFTLDVYVNGQHTRVHQAYLLTLSNHPYFGGGVKILPDANPTDGLLDLVVIEKQATMRRLIWILVKILTGNPYEQLPEVHRWTNAKIHLRTDEINYAHADGEELGRQAINLEFTTQPYPFWL
ncbi:diacylglycerol/lipid kinase family protein [Weissella soli]|uniref:diacylglycerol/lipid kinase family protein n=1 Tax=Weissella soli TaxID=155866 RepID=UPI00359F84F4